MKNFTKNAIYLTLFVFLFLSCSNGDEENTPNLFEKTEINGIAEKGPFAKNSKIQLIGLTEKLAPTSFTFNTEVTSDKGNFSLENISIPTQYALLNANGMAFSEILNENSESSLSAIVNLKDNSTFNINILTHIEKQRVEKLFSEGKSFSEAKKIAQTEVLKAFNIENTTNENSELLNLVNSAELIGLSVLLDVADNKTAFWQTVASDIAENGVLNNEETLQKVYDHASKLDLEAIRNNLEGKLKDSDNIKIPVFKDLIEQFIEEQSPFTIDIITTSPTCQNSNNGSIQVTVEGGTAPYTYQLNNGNSSSQNIFDSLIAGTYSVVVTDANGLKMKKDIELIDPTPIYADVVITHASVSGGSDGSVTIIASGGIPPYNYTLSGNSQNNNTFQNLSAGTYEIVINDANNCVFVVSANISEPTPLVLTADVTNTLPNKNEGVITVTASGGVPPYEYRLSDENWTTSNIFQNLDAASYNIAVRDSNGIITQLNVEITTITPEPITVDTQITNTTPGNNDGVIVVNASGGVPPYTYSLSGSTPTSNNDFRNLNAGTYEVQVIDAENNTATSSVVIIEMPPFDLTLVIVNEALCNGSSDGVIEAVVSRGTAPFHFEVTDTSGAIITSNTSTNGSTIINDLYANQYIITATDASGYKVSLSAIISEPAPINADLTGANTNGGNNGSITVNAFGGVPAYRYILLDSANNTIANTTDNVFNNLSAGTYTVQVIDSHGCFFTSTYEIQ